MDAHVRQVHAFVDDKFVDSTATQIYRESDSEDSDSMASTMKTQSYHQEGDSDGAPSGHEDPAPAPAAPASTDESGPSVPAAKRPRLGDAWQPTAADQLQLEAAAGHPGPVFN